MARIVVINAHPGRERLCTALAHAYAAGAAERYGADEVHLLNLGELEFDPVLHEGYAVIQELEPDLLQAQAAIREARHIVWVFPSWWGSMPALLKGFLDRVVLPRFGFSFYGPRSWRWKKLLRGRTTEFLITMDAPPIAYRPYFGALGKRALKYPLAFCGIRLTGTTLFGSVKRAGPAQIDKWIAKARRRGLRAR